MLRNWNILSVTLKTCKIDNISASEGHPGYYLKKLRILNNLKIPKIAKDIDVSASTLRNTESGSQRFNREISMKLAKYFNLDTKYFYDTHLEETDNIDIRIKLYMNRNNISLEQLSFYTNFSVKTLVSWIYKKRRPSRETYNKLKELNIL